MRAIDSCSPIASSWSSSRSLGFGQRPLARAISSLVTPARAERTTTISLPSSRAAFIRSGDLPDPLDVADRGSAVLLDDSGHGVGSRPGLSPPRSPIRRCSGASRTLPSRASARRRRAHRALVALVGGEDERGGARPLGRVLDDARDADAVARHDGGHPREHARPVRDRQPDVVAPADALRRGHPAPRPSAGGSSSPMKWAPLPWSRSATASAMSLMTALAVASWPAPRPM